MQGWTRGPDQILLTAREIELLKQAGVDLHHCCDDPAHKHGIDPEDPRR